MQTHQTPSPSIRRVITVVATAIALLLSMVVFATSASAGNHPAHEGKNRGNGPAATDNGNGRKSPGGSNGTVKIDGLDLDGTYDGHPNNEPHISCVFQVDLYGFDGAANADTAQLQFRHWNPSNGKVEITALGVAADETEDTESAGAITFEENRVTVPLASDGAGGGVDLDRQVLIKLDIPDTDPGAGNHHGHHVRLDTLVESDGRDYKKTKVFWVSECDDKGAEFACSLTGSTLSWDDQGPFTAEYNVVSDGEVLETLAADETSWDAGDAFGEFSIEAVDVAGNVTTSATTCIIDPPPAPAFDCAIIPATTTISWDAIAYGDYESDYVVTATNRTSGDTIVTDVPAGTTELTLPEDNDVFVEATWVDGTALTTATVCYIPLND